MYILDTETASLKGGVVEIAWLKVDVQLNILEEFVERLDPECEIEPGAYAVHGISNEDVLGKRTLSQIAPLLETPITLLGHNCLTGDHEVLTQYGWVKLEELGASIVAAVWNPQNSEITFEECGVVHQTFSGTMLAYDNIYHQGIYTKNHRVVYQAYPPIKPNGGWVFETAEAVSRRGPNSIVIPTAGVWKGVSTLGLSECELRLLEAIRADGSIEETGSVRLKLKKERKKNRISKLLQEAGVPYSRSMEGGATAREGVETFAILKCPFRDKAISILQSDRSRKDPHRMVWGSSVQERHILLDEMAFWDAAYVEDRSGTKKQVSITSSRGWEVELIQLMAVLSGRTSVVRLDKPNTRGFSRPDGTLSLVTVRDRRVAKLIDRPTTMEHTGTVHCLTTSTGSFVVRRNGVVWVTGNSSFDERMIERSISVERRFCTLELARKYVRGVSNYKLETLQKELNLPEQKSHSALGDVHTVRDLILYIQDLCGEDLPTLVERQQVPRVMHNMPFGKHAGTPLIRVPKPYRDWLLSKPDLDTTLRFSLERIKDI